MAIDDLLNELNAKAGTVQEVAVPQRTPTPGEQRLSTLPAEDAADVSSGFASVRGPMGDILGEQDYRRETDAITRQSRALASRLSFSTGLENDAGFLSEFQKTLSLKLDKERTEIGFLADRLNAGLALERVDANEQIRGIFNALRFKEITQNYNIGVMREKLREDIAMEKIGIGEAFNALAFKSLAESERSIRLNDSLRTGLTKAGDLQAAAAYNNAIAAILSGVGQVGFAGANITQGLRSPTIPPPTITSSSGLSLSSAGSGGGAVNSQGGGFLPEGELF